MKKKKINLGIRLIVVVTFLGMIFVNGFANLFTINGVTTGEVSLAYVNLFVPAPVTFIIWGVIYLALLGYVIYFLKSFQRIKTSGNEEFYNYVAIGFSISSIANIGWILSWHYDLMLMSMICIGILFVCLCFIDVRIKKEDLDTLDILFIRVPFSLYYGWITIATVANIVILLVKFSWEKLNGTDEFWTILIICISAIIAIVVLISGRDPVYGIAVLWGYIGILMKHMSRSGYGYQYSDIIIELLICIGILIILISYYFCTGKSYSKRSMEEPYEDFDDAFDDSFDDLFDEEINKKKTEEDLEEENIKHWVK